jgi:hypothetical protein
MTAPHCSREVEVIAAVRQRAWRVENGDFRQHLAECALCAEVAAACEALAGDLEMRRDVLGDSLPSAGQVWHRAMLRARAEGVQSASRSLVFGYGVAGAAVAGATAGIAWRWWPSVKSAWSRLEWSAPALPGALPLLFAAGACLALASVAVYLVVRGDQRL